MRCGLDFPAVLKQMCTRNPYLSAIQGHLPASQVELRFLRDIHPIVEPERFPTPPIAIMLAGETLEIFRDGDVNASVSAAASGDIGLARAAYLDFPNASFPVCENMSIRAALVVPDADGLRVTAAIGPRGSNRARHFSWRAGSDAVTGGGEVRGSVTELPQQHLALGISVAEYDEPIELLLGSRLIQTQNATRVASVTADMKFRASLS
jgi:hypothetical protein